MKRLRAMKIDFKMIAIAVTFALVGTFIDALVTYSFYAEGSFLDWLLLSIPPRELYQRLMILGSFFVVGYFFGTLHARRKQAEAAWQFSQFAVDHANDPAFWLEADGEIIYVNGAAIEALGYSRKEFLSMSVFDINPEISRGAWPEHWRNLKYNQEISFETLHQSKSGRTYPVKITASYLELGGMEYECAFTKELTQQKEAEVVEGALFQISRAAQYTENLDDLFAEVHRIIGKVMDAGNFYIALEDKENQRLEFAYFVDDKSKASPPRQLGKGLTEYILRTGKSVLLDATGIDELVRAGEIEIFGTPAAVWLGVPLRAEDQTIGAMAVQHYSDASALSEKEKKLLEFVSSEIAHAIYRKQTEITLRLERDRANQYLEVAGVVLLALDSNGIVTMINHEGCEVLGYEEDEILGKVWIENFVPPWVHAEAAEIFGHLMSGEIDLVNDTQYPVLTKAGEERIMAWQHVLLKDREGIITGTLSSGEDITERRLAERMLQETLIDLGRSNKELEQFAFIASHDLQEPIRMVVNYLQLLEQEYRDQLDAEAGEFIDYAVDGAERLQALIQSLLAYSRVDSQQRRLRPVDSEEIVRQALVSLQEEIQHHRAQVTFDPLPHVVTDRKQLTRVVQNLLENAIKFHGDQPPKVHLRAERKDGEWRFSVHDNGIGIDPQYAERIFVVFQRLHPADVYPGTGIGLAISKRIVEGLGGRIWVESEPGCGSTFHFTLPADGKGAE